MSAFYRATLVSFLADDPNRIIGELTTKSGDSGFVDLKHRQVKAWQVEISVLTLACKRLISETPESRTWTLFLEYPIIRRQKRIDAVILAADVIFCLEFKTKEKTYNKHAQQQIEDYALDLRDFHEQSRNRRIVPIVVVPNAPTTSESSVADSTDAVRTIGLANKDDLASILIYRFKSEANPVATAIDAVAWDGSAYRPVPTIIEAAEALFAGHNVREIAHSHAGAVNLTVTSEKLVEIIRRAQQQRQKIICFVTGIPGAGKTLAGLNVVHNPMLRGEGRPPAVFLSGNGPLVRIVSAAITRDFKRRARISGGEREVKTFVQNVHAFIRDAFDGTDAPPAENAIVFDEAQRAWDAIQTAKKTDQERSEPELMLSIMDRQDWAVIVALVGGGQEINTGEAGLAEWGRSLRQSFPHWRVAVSPEALTGDTGAGQRLFEGDGRGSVIVEEESALHLRVSLRAFRAQQLTAWVDAVMAGDSEKASEIVAELHDFPLAMTRSLITARSWLRNRTRGLRRCGLVASSSAVRLRAEGLELSSGFRQGNRDMYVHWFLDDPTDVRSSNQLEVAASEYECQGLELDWVGVCWGGDFTYDQAAKNWAYRCFVGRQWTDVRQDIDRRYLLNTYRVLLTRAREGLIIWVPKGDVNDSTRQPERFDATAEYLTRCGIPSL